MLPGERVGATRPVGCPLLAIRVYERSHPMRTHPDWINPDFDLAGVDPNASAVIAAVRQALKGAPATAGPSSRPIT